MERSLLSIERMVMRERALGGAKSNGAETSARDRTLPVYSAFVRLGYCRVFKPPAGGAGGNELSGRSRPGASAEGRGRTGASGGRVGAWSFWGFRPHLFCFCALLVCKVISPPEGGAGGNEQSGRSRPGACGGARADGREWGEGGGEAQTSPADYASMCQLRGMGGRCFFISYCFFLFQLCVLHRTYYGTFGTRLANSRVCSPPVCGLDGR